MVAVVVSMTAEALSARLAGAQLHAPELLPYEIDSAIRGLELGRRLSAAQASDARQRAHGIPVELWPWSLLGARAWELRGNLSSYDAAYVALAERLGAVLVTGDARIAGAPGLRCPVEVYG